MAEKDPLLGFHFGVEIQGIVSGYFTEVSGLGSEHELVEHKVVTSEGKEVVKMIPGRLKWENITLKRGITDNLDVWNWRKEVENGKVEGNRHDGSIVMYDQELQEVARWNFRRAWPVKVSGPQPKADSNEIGIEEMVIAHEYIERVS